MQHISACDHVEVDVLQRERAVGAGHMQSRALAVRTDRQHRRRGLHAILAPQIARVDAVALHGVDDKITQFILAERAHCDHFCAEFGEIDAGARRRARHRDADFLQQIDILPVGDARHGTPQNINDVDAKADNLCHACVSPVSSSSR